MNGNTSTGSVMSSQCGPLSKAVEYDIRKWFELAKIEAGYNIPGFMELIYSILTPRFLRRIRMAIFTFKDISALDDCDLQRALCRTHYYTLVDALKTADTAVRNKLLGNMSKKTAAQFKIALENAGTVSREESERAQQNIIKTIRDSDDLYYLCDDGFTFPNDAEIRRTLESAKRPLLFDGEFSATFGEEDELRELLQKLINDRDALAALRSLYIWCNLLPVFFEFPEAVDKIKTVKINGTAVFQWPHFVEKFNTITELTIRFAGDIPESIGALKNLRALHISDSKLESLPESIGSLSSLTTLTLEDNKNLKSLPESIGNLKNLTYLSLRCSSSLEHLPDSIANLDSLNYVDISATAIQSVPERLYAVKRFFDSKPAALIPQGASLSRLGFSNVYYKLLETVFRFSKKARRKGLLAIETDIKGLEDDIFKEGMRLIVNGTNPEDIRCILTLVMEREHDYYRKKLMGIAMEAILGIQEGRNPSFLVFRLNLMVDLKDNPIDAAHEKYLSGDYNAFLNIDFAAAIKPEPEREEVTFIKRAYTMSKTARQEGILALESLLYADAVAARDVFEYGLSLLVDGSAVDVWMGCGKEYLDAALGKLASHESDPVQKNIALAKREAVLSLYAGENPRILVKKLLAYFDKSIAGAVNVFLEEQKKQEKCDSRK